MIRRVLESRNYRWWAFAAVALGNFFSSMEQGSLIIAIPSIASHFGADIPTGQWVYLAYFLTISAALLPSGRLSDVVGRKRVYVAGLVLFIIGGTLASLSPSLVLVMVAKAIQGIGTGAMTANMMAIPVAVFPASARGHSLGLFSAAGSVGVVLGPVVGGSLVTAAGWRYAFLVPVALAVVTTVFVVLVLDERRISVARQDGSRPRFDSPGAVLSVAGLFVLLLALSRGQSVGWLSPWILAGVGGFAMLLTAFVAWELRSVSPMLDVRLFRRRTFSLGTTARAVFMFSLSSPGFLLPFYLQGVTGLTAGRAGVVMMTSSVMMVLTSPFCGLLSDRVGRKPFMAAGLILVALGFFLLSRATTSQTSVWLVVGGLALQGAGSGAFIAPNLSIILGATERERHGVTTALVNLVRTASNLTGVAIATAVVSGVMVWAGYEPRLDAAATAGAGDAFVDGMRYAFLVMMGIAALGVLACLSVDERRDRVEG